MAATIFASSSPSLSLTEMSTPAYNALSLVGQRIYLGNLLENWEIGKLYLCQTSSNHCQFFSHIVKFDFGLGNIFCGIVVRGERIIRYSNIIRIVEAEY